ncbi:SPASM domain-containing protein [Nanoarchaeota archaeon]
MTKEKLEKKFPITFPDKVSPEWKNSVKGWYVKNATPGLYTLDIEHVSDELVEQHNDQDNSINIKSNYSELCVHDCTACFNKQSIVYSPKKRGLDKSLILDEEGNSQVNKIMTLEETLEIVDQAMDTARQEGHEFESVKFLGPGELLMNPQLFEIIEAYAERGINLGIFTKSALLGSDEHAQKYQGMSAKELVDKLATYDNVSVLFSFQSFDDELQESLVTCKGKGIQGYGPIREKALENIFGSEFYQNGKTDRVCAINAPIVSENIGESFEIYKFFVERGTPVVMVPSMLSGKGSDQVEKQKQIGDWQDQLVELYARIYAFNVEKGIQTPEQIEREGIASYVGADPCNQVSTGLYIRANGIVQMCPGRFDESTVFANVKDKSLKEIWDNSPNKQRGIDNPQNLINNRCPAKDENGCSVTKDVAGFQMGFYERVMDRYKELTSNQP